jgi:TolA-binding protein
MMEMKNKTIPFILCFIYLVIAAQPARAADKWWDDAWEYCVEVKVDPAAGPDTDLVHARFPAAMCVQKGGADVRVVAGGEPVARTVVWAAPGRMCEVVFKLQADTDTYHIYYGNPDAKEPQAGVDTSGLLILETWERPRGSSNSWAEYWKLLDAKKKLYARGVRKRIYDGFNPFGPSGNFLSIYRGKIKCPAAGEYTFATASDDASFLFIGRKLVAQWPGRHGGRDGTFGKYNGKIQLARGVHSIEYYHESSGGSQAVVAGWKPPAGRLGIIPGNAFIRPKSAWVASTMRRGKSVAASFSYRKVSSIKIEGESFFLYRFRNKTPADASAKCLWDFGDGTTSAEKEPEHVFTGEQCRKVRLTVTTGGGSDAMERFVDTSILFLDTENVRQHKYLRVAKDYQIEKMPPETLKGLLDLYNLADWTSHMARCLRVILEKSENLTERERFEYGLRLAMALLEEGDADAEKIFSTLAANARPKYLAGMARLGLARAKLEISGNSGEARKIAQQIINEFGTSYKKICRLAELVIGDSHRAEGDAENARAAYERSKKYRTFKKDETQKAMKKGSYAQTVEHYLHRRQYRWALKTLKAWEDEYPAERLAGYTSLLKARAYFKLGKYGKASGVLDILVKANPRSNHAPDALMLLGECARALKDYKKAAEAFERVKKEYPESPNAPHAEKLAESCRNKSGSGE